MTEHHPLCPFDPDATDPTGECQCALIARVRAGERERHGSNCRGMWDEWLHDLREKVEALPASLRATYARDKEPAVVYRADVLALLDEEDGDD
jgi:hypothetical protein